MKGEGVGPLLFVLLMEDGIIVNEVIFDTY